MTLEEAKQYIQSVRWQYAKTYVTAPHEYTVLDWEPETKQQIIDFAKLIQEKGIKEHFGQKDFTILVIDNMKYWSMDNQIENTNLINRTYVDELKRKAIIDFVQSGRFNFIKGMSLSDITKQIECDDTSYILPQGNLPQNFPKPSEKELDDFRSYISNFKWKSAKTFEKFSPHQYILSFPCWKMKEEEKCKGESEACTECKKQRKEFENWVLFIRKYGERCKMQKTIYTVLCVDGRQYWTMGDPLETTWVLNRALINEPRRIPKLEWLDRI